MAMFGLDDQYAMYGVTPVENQFILEYLPAAKGDFVRVYLYGLLQSAHPQDGMSLEKMSHELSLPEEEVMSAYRYWERKGLVRRIADQPPMWRYLNINQRVFSGETPVDSAYADFSEAMYAIFGSDRQLHTREIAKAYEWVTDLHLPEELVLWFVSYKKKNSGKKFSFSAAEKQILALAEANVMTPEEAEQVLTSSKKEEAACRELLRRLGQKRDASEAELALYRKWTREWGYAPEAVEAASDETIHGTPSFLYLDGILKGMLERNGKSAATAEEVAAGKKADRDRADALKALLKALSNRDLSITEGTLSIYDELRTLYPDDIILLAGQECGRSGGDLTTVRQMLESWKNRGLKNTDEVQAYIRQFNADSELVLALYHEWGRRGRPARADREQVRRWQDELQLSREMILFCAAYAKDAEKPMAYLAKMLETYAAQGILTPEAAAQVHAAHQAHADKGGPAARKPQVPAQDYQQRTYTDSEEPPAWMLEMWKEMNADA